MIRHYLHKFYLLFATSLLFGINNASAQDNLKFEHFTSEDGLSENVVYAVFQDSKGYLWIGTHDGLNRYDGYGFKKFRHSPADSNSLPDNTIKSICEDGQGNIWLATNSGLCRYNPANGKFTRIGSQNTFMDVQQVLQINNEELIIKSGEQISFINTQTLRQADINCDSNSRNKFEDSIFFASFFSFLSKDSKGNIYTAKNINDSIVVWRYDNSHKSFFEFTRLPVDKSLAKETIRFFFIDSHNYAWILLSYRAPLLYDLSSHKIKTDLPKQPFIINERNQAFHIYEDQESGIWIATENGLLFYDGATGKTNRYRHDSSMNTISTDFIQTIYQDKTGIIWIGTSNGLNKLNPSQKKFRRISTEHGVGHRLLNNFVVGIYAEHNNQVRIHYWSKPFFSRFNFIDYSIHHYSIPKYKYADYLREVIVKNPEQLSDSNLKKATIMIQKVPGNAGKSGGGLLVDSRNNLWYISGGRLTYLNTLQYWEFDALIIDMQLFGEDIWLATNGEGLLRFHIPTLRITKYIFDQSKNSISSNDITCFIREYNGDMWIGTKGGGLNYFDRQKNIFEQYTEKNGLCNNSIYAMVKDDKGRLWMGTSYGLSCFDPLTKRFRNYFQTDGLVNSEFNRYSACKLDDGTLLMGGMNGIDYFHPDSLLKDKIKPQVQVTDFKVFNKSIYPGEILSLRHDQNYVTLEFAAMDFGKPEHNKFAYKLENIDRDWVLPENRNFVSYANLPPGKYLFLVKGSNSDGVWNDEPLSYKFFILPAWYQTWWFRFLIIALVITAIYMLFRYRLQQQMKLFSVRERIHRDLHDDVGATLSSVKAYSEILKDNPNNQVIAELIKDNSTEMLERLEVIAWATDPQHDNFKSLKSRMIKYAAPLCHSKNVQFSIEGNGINDEMLMPGEVRQNIFLVFKEAINNMIKYADAPSCDTQLFIRNNQFNLQIADEGKGFDGTIKGTGSGWKNMRKRTEGLNGKLLIESSPGEGTCITMHLPYPFKIPSSWDAKRDRY